MHADVLVWVDVDGQREFHLPQQATGGGDSIHGAAHDVRRGGEDPQPTGEADFGGNQGGLGQDLTGLHDVDWPQLRVSLKREKD